MSEIDFLDIAAESGQQNSYIKVIGVGGAGTNAVNHMFNRGITGVDFIVCNTDKKSLDSSPVQTKIAISELGAGNDPKVAEKKAIEAADSIKQTLDQNIHMLFIAAGMGGGTGTGASPVIAKIAKEIEVDEGASEVLVVAVVTIPFSFEGRKRREQAKIGIENLKKVVDAMIVVNTDKLTGRGPMSMKNAFALADDVLLTATKGIAEIITVDAYINVDFQDVRTVMQHSGVALMGSGIGEGDDRANKAIEAAMTSDLLNDNDFSKTKNILLYISYSSKDEYQMTTEELTQITNYVRENTNEDVDMIWGCGTDDTLDGKISITLVATGFESQEIYHSSERKTQEIEKVPLPIESIQSNQNTQARQEENITEIERLTPFVSNAPTDDIVKQSHQTETINTAETEFKIKNLDEYSKFSETKRQEETTNVITLSLADDDTPRDIEQQFTPSFSNEESKEDIMSAIAESEKEINTVVLPVDANINQENTSVTEEEKSETEQVAFAKISQPSSLKDLAMQGTQTSLDNMQPSFSSQQAAEIKQDRIKRIHDLLRAGKVDLVQSLRPTVDNIDEKLSEQNIPDTRVGLTRDGGVVMIDNPKLNAPVD